MKIQNLIPLLAAMAITATAQADSYDECYENTLNAYCQVNNCEDHVMYGAGQREAMDVCREPVSTCTKDETIVKIFEVTKNNFEADVTTDSVGGSYPSFHFNNLRQIATYDSRGNLILYRGKGFSLRIHYNEWTATADLSIPSTGIEMNDMNCDD